jgi:hypothetical protein
MFLESELEHYKALVDTLTELVFGYQRQQPSSTVASAATQESETSEAEREEFITKSVAELNLLDNSSNSSGNNSTTLEDRREALLAMRTVTSTFDSRKKPEPIIATNQPQKIKGRKAVSFHESVQIHYFGVCFHWNAHSVF